MLDFLFGKRKQEQDGFIWDDEGEGEGQDTSMSEAEQFIREQHPLYRHYCLSEVQICVKQFTGINLTHNEARNIVQKIRDEMGYGPIADYNL